MNRKSYAFCQMLPMSMILSDLNQPKLRISRMESRLEFSISVQRWAISSISFGMTNYPEMDVFKDID